MKNVFRLLPFATLLLTGGCAYDYAQGYAPDYPAGYDNGQGGGEYYQPGDLFGGQNVGSADVFYAPLSQYGDWIDSRFGRAFRPNAPQGWRPYVNGRWGENRLWISNDPWGWATDHYGRWGFDERAGWVWVPGTAWAPSWVAWREADDVTGWAPIPPGVSYSVSVGFGSGWGYDNYNSWYAPSWVWVPRGNLYRPGFGGRVLPWTGGFNYWRGSRWNYNSGWNGRPGYGRPNPGYNGGYYGGRPRNNDGDDRGRYNNGRPPANGGYRPGTTVSDGIAGGIIAGQPGYRPNDGRPYDNRGGNNWQGRQNNGRPNDGRTNDWRQNDGRPNGNNWQGSNQPGEPIGNRPPGSVYQGGRNPNAGQDGGYRGGNRPGNERPGNGIGNAIGGSMTAPMRPMEPARPTPSYQAPPQMQSPAPQVQRPAPQVQRPAPQVQRPAPQAERPAPPVERPQPQSRPMSPERENERPQ